MPVLAGTQVGGQRSLVGATGRLVWPLDDGAAILGCPQIMPLVREGATSVRHPVGQTSPLTGALQRPRDRRSQNHGQPVEGTMSRLLPHVTPRMAVLTLVRIMPAGHGPEVPTDARQRFVCHDCIRVHPGGQEKTPEPSPPLATGFVGRWEARGVGRRDGRRFRRVEEHGTWVLIRAPVLDRTRAEHMRTGDAAGMRVKRQGRVSGTPCTITVHMAVGRVGGEGRVGAEGGQSTSVQTPATVRKHRLPPFICGGPVSTGGRVAGARLLLGDGGPERLGDGEPGLLGNIVGEPERLMMSLLHVTP